MRLHHIEILRDLSGGCGWSSRRVGKGCCSFSREDPLGARFKRWRRCKIKNAGLESTYIRAGSADAHAKVFSSSSAPPFGSSLFSSLLLVAWLQMLSSARLGFRAATYASGTPRTMTTTSNAALGKEFATPESLQALREKGWSVSPETAEGSTQKLLRDYKFKNFIEAWGFMSRVAIWAEKLNVRPGSNPFPLLFFPSGLYIQRA